MKYLLTILLFTLTLSPLWAQPSNDDCTMPILFPVDSCSPAAQYTNVNATETLISSFPPAQIPSCWNGADRDVWFTFATGTSPLDFILEVNGSDMGMGTIVQPQIALYRGDCVLDDLAELACASAAVGEGSIELEVLGLDPFTLYFVRVNDYSLTAQPNAGTFQFCLKEFVPPVIMSDGSTTECNGTIVDSGGEDNPYSSNENFTYTITPSDSNNCISLVVNTYDIQQGTDFLDIYDGDDPTTAPLIGQVSGNGSNYEIQASSGSMTLVFSSNFTVEGDGFFATWSCTTDTCTIAPFSSCDFPTTIPGIPFSIPGQTTCTAGNNYSSADACGSLTLDGEDYVFVYDSPGDECFEVSALNSNFGTGVFIVDGCPDDPMSSCLAFGEDGSASVNVENPTTLYIIVANDGGCTPFDLNIDFSDCPPTNDFCETATFITDFSGYIGSTSGDYTPDAEQLEFDPFCGSIENNSWYSFIADSTDAVLEINVGNDTCFDAQGNPDVTGNIQVLFIQTDDCQNFTQVEGFVNGQYTDNLCWDPIGGDPFPTPLDSSVLQATNLTPGEEYYIMVDGFGGDECNYTINAGPGVLVTQLSVPADTVVCSQDSVQLYALLSDTTGFSDFTYSWVPNVNISDSSIFNPIVTPDTTTTYTVTVEIGSTGNTFTESVTVTVVDSVVAQINISDTTICQGQSVQLVGSGGGVFEWLPSMWLSDSTAADPIAQPQDTITYEFVTFASCGTDTASVTINVQNALAEIAQDTVYICKGGTIFLSVTTEGTGGTGLSWSPDSTLTCGDCPFPTAFPFETTTYVASYNTDACTVSDSIVVKVDSLPEANFIEDTLICPGEMVILSYTAVTTGYPDIEFLWTPNSEILFGDTSTSNIIVTPGDTTTYIRYTTNGACSSVDSVTVYAPEIPIITAMPVDTTICIGDTVQLFATSSDPNFPIEWAADPTLSCTDCTDPIAVPTQTTTYILNAGQVECAGLATVTVNVSPEPVFDLIDDDGICEGERITLGTIPGNAGSTYDWSPSNSIDPLTLNTANPDALPIVTTTYTLTATNGACTATDQVTIEVTPDFDLSIELGPNQDNIICPGESVDLTAIHTSQNTPIFYGWDNNLGDQASVTVMPSTTTTYNVTVNDDNCSKSTSVTIVVLSPPSLSGVINNTTICPGDSIALQPSGGQSGVEYVWTLEDGTIVSNSTNPFVSPDSTTTYFVMATSEQGCESEGSVTIDIAMLDVNVTEDTVYVCEDASVSLGAEGTGGNTFNWGPNVNINGANTAAPTVSPNSNQVYVVEYTVNGNCPVYDSVLVIVGGTFDVIILQEDTTLFQGAPVVLGTALDTLSGNQITGVTYEWSPLDWLLTSNDPANPTAAPLENISYTVTATSFEGCSDTYGPVNITVIPPNYDMPNAFTPNGDEDNDYFRPVFSDGALIEVDEFRIFDRWGEMVFDNEDTKGWDGTFRGRAMPQDVYVYKVRLKLPSGQLVDFKGNLTLLR